MGAYFTSLCRVYDSVPEPDVVVARGEDETTTGRSSSIIDRVLDAARAYSHRYPPHAWVIMLASAGLFSLGNAALPRILPALLPLPAGETKFTPSQYRKFAYYITSLGHHLIVAPLSAYRLWTQFTQERRVEAGEETAVDYRPNALIAGITGGYFIADFVATLPDAVASPDCFLHHVIALNIIFGGLSSHTVRFVPHVMVTESSSILLDVMWAMRQYNAHDSLAYALTGVSFVVVYTLTRIVHMPMTLLALMRSQKAAFASLGASRYALLGAQVLQFYWWYKILQQFAPMLRALVTIARMRVGRALRVC